MVDLPLILLPLLQVSAERLLATMTEPYGDTRRSFLRRPATPPGRCIVETITAINSEHSACVRSSIDLRLRARRPGTLFANLPDGSGWTGSLRSRFRNSAPSLCTYGKDIGANELTFSLSTMLTLFALASWHILRAWLWGALDRGDGRKLDTSLCTECSPDSYDTGEPSGTIRDPRGRPREPFACLGGYGRLRRETPVRERG